MTRTTSKNQPMCGKDNLSVSNDIRAILQDIYHVCNGGNSMDKRRVYGVEPVNCKLQVVNLQGSCQMQLYMSQ